MAAEARPDVDERWETYRRTGDPELRNRLVEDHLTLARAFAAFQYLSAQSQGAPPEVVEEMKDAIVATPDQPREINEAQLAQRFHDFVRSYGPDHPFVQGILEGRTPEGLAAVIMDASMLADSSTAVAALNRCPRDGGQFSQPRLARLL